MNTKNNRIVSRGAALLVVLIIIMAITISSLGFLTRSDVELACGENMILRTQMDYLAESGLEHARGLILNPQDISAEYWTGYTGLQIVSGSSDYYDVTVVRDVSDRCNYIIDCNSYRLEGTEKIGRSSLKAELRLDPCIAYWVGSSTEISPKITINGDVYCDGDLTNNGDINGDVFAVGAITGANLPEGQTKIVTPDYPVAWPDLVNTDFGPMYYIGSTEYQAQLIDANVTLAGSFIPSAGNPAGICYCVGDVNMPGNVNINGMLVVNGNLTVSGPNNVITPVNEFHFPALLVCVQVVMKDVSSLEINGLAQIEQPIADDPNTTSASIYVTGGLFIANGGVTSDKVSVNITAAPEKASIEIWPYGVQKRWGPAAGAFFKSIERK